MKVGSLVEHHEPFSENFKMFWGWSGVKFPVINGIYVVRGLYESDGVLGLFLEEIINPVLDLHDGKHEFPFIAKNFREIEIDENFLEQVEELKNQETLVEAL